MCLRLTGSVRKTQVTALVTQDDKQVKRLSLQTFTQYRDGDVNPIHKHDFTFRSGEFERLVAFLDQIKFVDLSNLSRFQIEDISTQAGPKLIVDAMDKTFVSQLRSMNPEQRNKLFSAMQKNLSEEEINILLGRKQGLQEFEQQLQAGVWGEKDWQDFFDREQWVFGYGLDYRVMRKFDREMTVGTGGTDNKDRPIIDFLMGFTDYTVLVEIKKPNTPIFRESRGGRAGTWELSSDFNSAVSQILEQKAEWLSFAQSGDHFNKDGRKLEARTRNTKSILVIGSLDNATQGVDERTANVMRDTFELFRNDMRSIDIITYDELLSRARFIARS